VSIGGKLDSGQDDGSGGAADGSLRGLGWRNRRRAAVVAMDDGSRIRPSAVRQTEVFR
jgi:hypothetical protein